MSKDQIKYPGTSSKNNDTTAIFSALVGAQAAMAIHEMIAATATDHPPRTDDPNTLFSPVRKLNMSNTLEEFRRKVKIPRCIIVRLCLYTW
jgi:hypothetical protein